MKAAALVEGLDHVCVRYRLAAFQAALTQAGHSLTLIPFSRSLFGRLKQYQTLGEYDAVILQRTLLSRFELNSLRTQARKLIFDFDDAIWRRDSYAVKGPASLKRSRRFARTMQSADQVIAGNEFLAAKARSVHANVAVIPSCVDKASLVNRTGHRARPSDSFTLVWIGSSSTLRSLEDLKPTLAVIGKAFPHVRLKLICDRFASFDPLPVECVTWSAETEHEHLMSADAGIAVMPDDDWSRGKCGVKVLQYMAAGLPVIATPVGVHLAMVKPEVTGYLAFTTEGWLTAIRRLQDADSRKMLGDAGRTLVETHYSVDVGSIAWVRLFDQWKRRAAG